VNPIRKIIRETLEDSDVYTRTRKSSFGDGIAIDLFKRKKKIGKMDVVFKDDMFSYWEKNFDKETDENLEDGRIAYVIGISIVDKSELGGKSYKRQGYGKYLYEMAEEYAKENGAKYIALGSVTSALGFWKKMGFKIHSLSNFFNMYKKL
jgi:GNAT superfamily N-acetyltransferase